MTQSPEAAVPAASSLTQSPLQRNSQLTEENGSVLEPPGGYGSAGMAHSLHGAVAARRQAITELLFFASVGDRDRCEAAVALSRKTLLTCITLRHTEFGEPAQAHGQLLVARPCAHHRPCWPHCTNQCSHMPAGVKRSAPCGSWMCARSTVWHALACCEAVQELRSVWWQVADKKCCDYDRRTPLCAAHSQVPFPLAFHKSFGRGSRPACHCGTPA